MRPYLSVVVPVFNCAATVERHFFTLLDYLQCRKRSWEVILVDDGSGDGTSTILDYLARDEQQCRVIHTGRNRGKGYAVKHGALACRGDLMLMTDADMATPLVHIEVFEEVLRGADIAIGSRKHPGSVMLSPPSLTRRVGGAAGNVLIRELLGLDFRDTQYGFKMFKRKSLALFSMQTVEGFGFDFEILYLARRYGLRVAEVAIHCDNPSESVVHLRDFYNVFRELLQVRRNVLRRVYPAGLPEPPQG